MAPLMNPELPETSRNGTAGVPEFPVIPTEYGKTGNGKPWQLMLCHLRGKRPPALPRTRGTRRHIIATDADALTVTDRDALLLDTDMTDKEIGAVLGVTRQRAHQLRQALRQRLANEETNP